MLARPQASSRTEPGRALFGGGPAGNELLTTVNGAVLIVLLAVLGLTIVALRQLLVEHLFIGLVLLGPLALKLASTGYRFARYYTGDHAYVSEGPPPILLRLLAPGVVLLTMVVFASGVVLLFTGPGARDPWLLIHKVSFVLWLGAMAIHVLGHLNEVLALFGRTAPAYRRGSMRADRDRRAVAGDAGRAIALAGAIVGGVVVAVALIPHFSAWTWWMAHRLASG